MAETGTIFNIQRYSLHDGDGIRTNVFFKGCPMYCKWCSNPESQKYYPEVSITESNCIGCGYCRDACPSGALGQKAWDEKKCTFCRECESACPTGALKLLGKSMTVAEVVEEVTKDLPFYRASGGGVTFTGGEPIAQSLFAEALAKKLKELYIHLAIETSGYAPWEDLERVVLNADQILYDIKHMDPAVHQIWTGVENVVILDNAEKVAKLGKDLIIRLPVIGGINDDHDNVNKTALFAKQIGVREIHFLPYHRFGEVKYKKLNKEYDCDTFFTPKDDRIQLLKNTVEGYGLKVSIGG